MKKIVAFDSLYQISLNVARNDFQLHLESLRQWVKKNTKIEEVISDFSTTSDRTGKPSAV